MRLEMAKLFLAAEPVDQAAPRAVLRQRLEVYSKFIRQGDKNFPWLAGRFDIDFDGAIMGNIENKATELFRRGLQSSRSYDILRGMTSVGPHRDDFKLILEARMTTT